MEKLLTPEEAAELLGLTTSSLKSLRFTGKGPEYLKLTAKAVRYTNAGLEAWVEAKVRQGTSDLAEVQ
jgi:predicted DNA-binding transcriptional regulator AlpA